MDWPAPASKGRNHTTGSEPLRQPVPHELDVPVLDPSPRFHPYTVSRTAEPAHHVTPGRKRVLEVGTEADKKGAIVRHVEEGCVGDLAGVGTLSPLGIAVEKSRPAHHQVRIRVLENRDHNGVAVSVRLKQRFEHPGARKGMSLSDEDERRS